MSETRRVQPLSADHAEGLRALSSEPDFAGAAGVDLNLTLEEARKTIATAVEASEEGRAYVFVLTRGTDVLGVCRLIGARGVPRAIVSIGGAYRGQGNGLFVLRHVVDFAFETLKLERVTAGGACLQLLSRLGRLDGNSLTRSEWLAARPRTSQ